MTPEEGRALFPVLERVAYLNAGTFGPLARPTADAVRRRLDADLERGRVGKEYFEQMLELRTSVRAAVAALVGAGPEHVSLTASTTDGCNIVLAGLELGAEDEIVTTDEEHFGLARARLHASGARVVVAAAEPEAILAAVDAEDAPARAVAGPLDERPRAAGARASRDRRASRSSSTARSRSARSPSTRPGSTSSRSPGRSGSAAPTRPARSSSPTRSGCASPGRATSPQSAHEPAGSFEPAAGARASIPAGSRPAVLAGLATALGLAAGLALRARRRAGGSAAASCSRRRRASSRARPTLVAFRAERPDGARGQARRGGRGRPRDPGHGPRPRLVRLVDERRRPRPARRRDQADPRRWSELRGVGRGAQPELARDRLQRGDDVAMCSSSSSPSSSAPS